MLLATRIELEIERIIMPEKNGNDAQWLDSNFRTPKTRRCIGGIKYVIVKAHSSSEYITRNTALPDPLAASWTVRGVVVWREFDDFIRWQRAGSSPHRLLFLGNLGNLASCRLVWLISVI